MTQFSSKVCIVGDFAVGKTSTVERFVNNQFSERYLTTIGVKVDTREVDLGDDLTLKLVLWDVAGTDRFGDIEFAYLRGASGLILVADGTRGDTVSVALALRAQAEERYGALPSVFLLNKSDLTRDWEVSAADADALRAECGELFITSAKTGENVALAMHELARLIASREIPQAR
jgi:small GTP-binding protein